eukprot:GHVN01099234.1.p1 GENE.GHVN01099234.1~~GHVN01099234.1.p1  ORF type:complete len:128 (+),score=20.20 GHVN01099234.1:147-530(+)
MSLLTPEAAVTVGTQFVQHYYQTFAGNREGLASLYSDESMMTYEDTQVRGAAAIVDKLKSLTFTKIQHVAQKCDIQPAPGNGVIVFVTGDVSIDEGAPLKYAQCFNLQPNPNGGYYIFNDLFRLNIG